MAFSNFRIDCAFAVAILAAFASLSGVTSQLVEQTPPQEIGTDICFCAPNTYEFKLDFSLTCPPVNITLGDAVAATTCMVSPFGMPEVADLVPVKVTSIDVLELNQNLQVMVQENIEPKEAYLDGDTFSYVSYAAVPGQIVKPEDVPRAIQLNIIGSNAKGEQIINVYLITFTNACGAYPVLFEGQWAGWTRFVSFHSRVQQMQCGNMISCDRLTCHFFYCNIAIVQFDLGPPNLDLCPLAAPPTAAPSEPPTMPLIMSMSMSMDLGELEALSIEDLLDGGIEYQEYKSKGKGKGGKNEKSKKDKSEGKGNKKDFEKLTKPYSKDGKAKDGKGKDGKSKDGKSKDGTAKDGKAKDGNSYKYGKPQFGKDGKSKDGKSKDGKAKDGKAKDGAKDGKSKDGAKAGAKAGKSDKVSTKETNKLTKPGDKDTNKLTKPGSKDGKAKDGKAKDGKSKDGSKAGKSKDGAKAGNSEKSKDGAKAGKSDKSKDGAKAGKSYKYEGNGQKQIDEAIKDANKLTKSSKYQGKGKDGKSEKQRLLRLRI